MRKRGKPAADFFKKNRWCICRDVVLRKGVGTPFPPHYTPGCSANKKVWERTKNSHFKTASNSFLKQNVMEVWWRRSHTFPLHCTPVYVKRVVCSWATIAVEWSSLKLLRAVYVAHKTTEKPVVTVQQGSPNFFVRGPNKAIQNMSRAGHLTQSDYCGVCCILPNQQIFRKYCILFFIVDKMASRAVVGRPLRQVPRIHSMPRHIVVTVHFFSAVLKYRLKENVMRRPTG